MCVCVCVCVCVCCSQCAWFPLLRRAFPPNGNTVCRLRIGVDSRFFTNVGGSSVVAVNNEITTIFNEVNRIFSGTDFNFDRQADGIRFALAVQIYQSASEPTAAFANDNIAVSDFLDLWSQVSCGGGAGLR